MVPDEAGNSREEQIHEENDNADGAGTSGVPAPVWFYSLRQEAAKRHRYRQYSCCILRGQTGQRKAVGGQRSGRSGRPGRSDRSDKSGNVGTISEERDAEDTKGTKGTALAAGIYGGICAAGSHSCSIPWLSGGGGYHFSDTMDEKQRAGAGEGDAFYPDNSTGTHSGF